MRLALKKKREELGYTQEALAKKIEVARTTYTNIELGEKDPSFKIALKIKEVLNYSNDDIFFNVNVANRNTNRIQAS